jgi:hypothetical protein
MNINISYASKNIIENLSSTKYINLKNKPNSQYVETIRLAISKPLTATFLYESHIDPSHGLSEEEIEARRDFQNRIIPCALCTSKGTHFVDCPTCVAPEGMHNLLCETCNGEGKVELYPCPLCDGYGYRVQDDKKNAEEIQGKVRTRVRGRTRIRTVGRMRYRLMSIITSRTSSKVQ